MGESLGRALAEVARRLAEGVDVVEGLQALIERAAEHVPEADVWAYLGAGPSQRVFVTTRVDGHVLPVGGGPCTDAVQRGEEVRADTADELRERWGDVGDALADAGYDAVHVIPLGVNGETVGTLMVTRRCPCPLDERELDACRAFSALASVGLSLHQSGEETVQLQHALQSRVTVEQAKGIVAATMGVPVGIALEVMRRFARGRNLRLADVAADVVAGALRPEELAGVDH